MGGKGSGGHNRKTTAEHIASGTYRHSNHARRSDVISPRGEPIRPEGMTVYQRRLWDAVVSVMPAAALGEADTPMMCEMIRWFGVYCKNMELLEKEPTDSKLIQSAQRAWEAFRKIALDYGLTPQARATIPVPESKAGSALGALVERMAG